MKHDMFGQPIQPGDWLLTDNGHVYEAVNEQYGSGNFVRAKKLMRRNQPDLVVGQHGECTVKVNKEDVAELIGQRRALMRLFEARRSEWRRICRA